MSTQKVNMVKVEVYYSLASNDRYSPDFTLLSTRLVKEPVHSIANSASYTLTLKQQHQKTR